MTIVLNSLLCINILEACVTQISNFSKNRDKFENAIDVSNGVVGVGVIGSVVYNAILGNLMTIVQTSDFINVKTQINIWTAISYTFWNLLFRIQIGKTTSVLPFFVSSLALPIYAHYVYGRDWVHTRAICLMMWMILALGFGKDEMRMLPMYTTDTLSSSYPERLSIAMTDIKFMESKSSLIVKIQENEVFRTLLVVGGSVTCVMSFFMS